MESAVILPLNLEKPDTDVVANNLSILEVNEDMLKDLDTLKAAIFNFKQQLYSHLVTNDKKHEAADLGSIMTFHALFLQSIAYYIGMLDSQLVPEPKFSVGRDRAAFLKLKGIIEKVADVSSESRIMVYSVLFQFSTQHAFDLGVKK
jgi:hypothetical protein